MVDLSVDLDPRWQVSVQDLVWGRTRMLFVPPQTEPGGAPAAERGRKAPTVLEHPHLLPHIQKRVLHEIDDCKTLVSDQYFLLTWGSIQCSCCSQNKEKGKLGLDEGRKPGYLCTTRQPKGGLRNEGKNFHTGGK